MLPTILVLPALYVCAPAQAHHSAAGDLGQSNLSRAPIQNAGGKLSLANHRLSLDQTLYRISETPTFVDPVAEDSMWWWTSLSAAVALSNTLELGLTIPMATRFSLQDSEQEDVGFGDLRFGSRYFLFYDQDNSYNLSLGSELSLPTGSSHDGFSAKHVVQHAAFALRVVLGSSDVIVGSDAGLAWSYEQNPQLAADYRLLVASPEFVSMRLSASVQGQSFFFDSSSSLQSIPSQRRSAGDSLFVFSSAINASILKNLLVIAGVDLPLSSKKNFDWACSLSLQYWFSSQRANN
ncbi:MAG: hypothetical protein IPJ88_17670 [Myxococcales bacterium]|nr:MAG: hypothetical protein IPJ88_17670 [Myxococcales bacterium]